MEDDKQIQELKDEAINRLINLNKKQLEELIVFLHNVIHIE